MKDEIVGLDKSVAIKKSGELKNGLDKAEK